MQGTPLLSWVAPGILHVLHWKLGWAYVGDMSYNAVADIPQRLN